MAVLVFKRKDFTHTKSTKSTKRKQMTFTQMFLMSIKSTKSTKKSKKAQKRTKSTKRQTLFLLDVFYAHKNITFFVFVRLDNFKLLCFFLTRTFYTHKKHKKHKKHIKSIKTQISDFLPLRYFLSSFKTIFCFCFCLLNTRIHYLFVGTASRHTHLDSISW